MAGVESAAMRNSLQISLVAVCLVLPGAISLDAQRAAESRNVELVGHNGLR